MSLNLRRRLLRWRGRKKGLKNAPLLAWIGIGVTVAVLVVAGGSWGGLLVKDRIESGCGNNPFGCGALVEFLGTVVALALAFAAFAYWRVLKIADLHRQRAHEEVSRFVHPVPLTTTGGRSGNKPRPPRVVGRESICQIIEHDLREEKPRPQLIVGGVGDGKTAVLLRLAEMLAQRGAVPVPVRLRDAPPDLDLLDLASERFQDRVKARVFSSDEGEKIWRKLCNDRRVVVLADGLEEALIGNHHREQIVANALAKAQEDGIPVVITSRPDRALDGVDAAVIRLEPLPADEATEYLAEAIGEVKHGQLAQIAEVANAPFYLRLARELPAKEIVAALDACDDRLRLRVRLLERWVELLMQRELLGSTRILESDRRALIDELGPPTCKALAANSLELEFEGETNGGRGRASADPRFVAAERLGLVENVTPLVASVESPAARFRHSIMQAYIGARRLPELAHGPDGMPSYISRGLERPGRELLMAVTMACCIPSGPEGASRPAGDTTEFRSRWRERLCGVVRSGEGAESFDALAAAYEIHRLVGDDQDSLLAEEAKQLWSRSGSSSETRTGRLRVAEAKLRAVSRIAESGSRAAYGALLEICFTEDDYRVRLHAAQKLGAGGDHAYQVMPDEVRSDRALKALLRRCANGPEQADVRKCSVLGWTLPILATSRGRGDACARIEEWAEFRGGHLGVQACLAQGLKYEANRRFPEADHEIRPRLIRAAKTLLKQPSWWYADIALYQALALWSLADGVDHQRSDNDGKPLEEPEHPYVRRAAELCRLAVRRHPPRRRLDGGRGNPSRYIWIDEAGVVGKIGADSVAPDSDYWIPVAAGWYSLDPTARKLVADVFLYLNLIEHGEGLDHDPNQRVLLREERRRRVAAKAKQVPPCIAHGVDEGRMRLQDKLRPAESSEHREDRKEEPCCDFGLCAYPAEHQKPFRGELGETFCREQQRLLKTKRARVLSLRLTPEPVHAWEALEQRAQEPMQVR